MYTRFGRARDGDTARLSYTLFAILTITALLGYGAVGMGKFGAIFLKRLLTAFKEACY